MTKKATIMVVDDEPAVLASVSKILSPYYQVRAVNLASRTLSSAQMKPRPDLILLDVIMPEMDGYQVMTHLKTNQKTRQIPVIFVTAMEAQQDEEKGFKIGAVDYITKPVKPAILLARVETHLTLKKASDFLIDKNDFLEAEVSRRMSENQLIQQVSIRALAHLAETRDMDTGDHILRTQAYVHLLANLIQKLPDFKHQVNDRFIALVTQSAPLHDIGKVGIPDNVLLKPGKLNQDEWEIMKTHSWLGAKAIENAENDVANKVEFLSLAKEICHWHHERWDGQGYPDGLSGEQIPLSARLMSIADVFDALISKRVYKDAIPYAQAAEIIRSEQNTQFDPVICRTFLNHFNEFMKIADKYKK